jgi:bacterial leucyl aminopeptidase
VEGPLAARDLRAANAERALTWSSSGSPKEEAVSTADRPVVFFDIGQALGEVRLAPATGRLDGLLVYPHVPPVLQRLKDAGVRMGIISNTGEERASAVNAVLASSGLLGFFDSGLLVYSREVGLDKGSPEIFLLAARLAGQPDHRNLCVYVGEDSSERKCALDAGMRVAPHPDLVFDVLEGLALRYLRVSPPGDRINDPWRSALKAAPLAPVHVAGEQGTVVYGIASHRAVAFLIDSGLSVELLGPIGAPLATQLYLVRDDLAARTGFLVPSGQSARFLDAPETGALVLASSPMGLVVALPAGRRIGEYHFPQAFHGHHLKLVADVSLLEPFGVGAHTRRAAWLGVPEFVEQRLSSTELETLRTITDDVILQHVHRYTGTAPPGAPGGERIQSRHVRHADNARATDALVRDLDTIGGGAFQVRLRPFVHDGATLFNVEAELRGASDELVLIAAHLDSTAAFSSPFEADTDPAPGADDDGSGVAAVLAAAGAITKLAGPALPRRSVRFVLFNAEEDGLVGSDAYARAEAAAGAAIVAVFQMDMVGYNKLAPRSFEVHAGYTPSRDVQNRSIVLARRVEQAAAQTAPTLAAPQLYVSEGSGHDHMDPAEGRSDHSSFHRRGYAACCVSEDFFVGPEPSTPQPEPNPNYHTNADVFVDPAFTADVARAIAGAAWLVATR